MPKLLGSISGTVTYLEFCLKKKAFVSSTVILGKLSIQNCSLTFFLWFILQVLYVYHAVSFFFLNIICYCLGCFRDYCVIVVVCM